MNTLTSLQQPSGACKQARRPKKGKTEATVAAPSAPSHFSFGKDTGLALFHALGKILYNKRLEPGIDEVDNLASSLTLGQGVPPAGSQAGLMPNSSKECKVADRYCDVVLKLPCWHGKSLARLAGDKCDCATIVAAWTVAAWTRVDKQTHPTYVPTCVIRLPTCVSCLLLFQ